MSAEPAWTVVLSGPENKRANVEVALERKGLFPLPDDHHAHMGMASKLPSLASGKKPKVKQGFITVQADDVDEPARIADKHGWVLRAHYPTPDAPKPDDNPLDALRASVHDLQQQVAALKARGV